MADTLSMTARSATLLLPSGRHVGIAEYGDHTGRPLFLVHGFAGSRLQWPPDGTIPPALGLRLIAVDRPGIGLSDRAPQRRLLDWPAEVAAVADALQVERFAILGWSAGAPHALACAYGLGERVSALGLASPMGGWFVGPGATRHISREARGFATLVQYAPWVLRLVLRQLRRRILRNPARMVTSQLRALPARDRATLAQPALHQMLVATLGEAFRQGSGGVYDDTVAVSRPWEFSPTSITIPTWIWQGEADTTVLPALACELAGKLPHVTMQMFPDEGHFLLFTHWEVLLQTLARAMPPGGGT